MAPEICSVARESGESRGAEARVLMTTSRFLRSMGAPGNSSTGSLDGDVVRRLEANAGSTPGWMVTMRSGDTLYSAITSRLVFSLIAMTSAALRA